MDFTSHIIDGYLIFVPALYVLGMILKAIPNAPNWLIPFILLGVGVTGCVFLSLRPDSGTGVVEAVLQGILTTGAAVLVNQGIKQVKEKE